MEDEQKIQRGRKPTAEDLFYRDWAAETLKNSNSLLNDVLGKYAALNAAIVASGVIFGALNACSVCALVFFFLGFLISAFGMVPYVSMLESTNVEEIRRKKKSATHWKLGFTIGTIASMAIGGILLLLSLI